ncbi:winged helix-turn-helix domain-containing protein [Aurantiacibacter sp. MUD61]|uniref:winged helix-turn-helix domain-containing protein n=1 Tax=Aurantiacibacter sp. MUD61 TaxID=3009083 RepID=UPI0022F05D4A|nr:winged helix-turn-helix domain-containing protein [Aurantiacibacter sp. MUD61]
MNIEGTGSLSSPRIDLAHEQPFTLGPVLVEPALRKLTAGSDEETVEPKVMQVLVALGRDPGAILSRDDLIDCCWEGRIVGDASVNRVMSLLRSVLRELADEAVTIETLPKVGYRVLVTKATVEEERHGEASPAAIKARSLRSRPLALAGIVLAVLLVVALGWFWASRPNTAPLTVVMLPIEASEGIDPLYASGMEAEIRSQLGRSVNMEVRTGDSAGQLVEQGRSPQQIGEALNVDLVWQGEISNSANSVVLDVRLVAAADGEEVWQESLQSAPNSAQFLPTRAVRAMLEALGRAPNPEARQPTVSSEDYALYLTAMGLIRGRGTEQRLAAVDILEQVVARNPRFADGLAGLAKANFLYPTTDSAISVERRETALELAEEALALDPRSVDALKVSGMLLTDSEERLARLHRATEIDPGDAEGWFWLGIVQRQAIPFGGDFMETSRRMVAVDPLWPASWRASDGAVEFGDFALARDLEERIIAASATEPQRELARARLVRLDGDLSEFLRMVRDVTPDLSEAEQRWGYYAQLRFTRFLLGLPAEQARVVYPRDAFVEKLRQNELPTLAEFREAGLDGADFWGEGHIVSEATPMLLREGREAELLQFYDARFAGTEDFIQWAEGLGVPFQIIPQMSPYMALAMQRLGRDGEAREHIALARRYNERWRETGTTTVFSLLAQLELAAIENDEPSAIAIVRQLPDYGWPLQLSHMDNQALGLLVDDPLYDRVRELPEVRAVLDPIRAHIARERAEVLALGL